MKHRVIDVLVGVGMGVALTFALRAEAEPVVYTAPAPVVEQVVEPEKALPVLDPGLVRICTCESGQGTGKPQQFDIKTGEVLRGTVNPQDIGMCQINLKYHGEAAEAMGLDIFTESGNIEYANFLYTTRGTRPWSASVGCWRN